MNRRRTADTRPATSPWLFALAGAAALVLPLAAIGLGADELRRSLRLPAAPFGAWEFAIVHLLAVQPAAWLAGRWWMAGFPDLSRRTAAALLAVLGGGLAAAWIALAPAIAELLELAEAGPTARFLVRTAVVLSLALPWWCVAAVARPGSRSLASRGAWRLIALAGLALPLVHRAEWARTHPPGRLVEWWESGQPWRRTERELLAWVDAHPSGDVPWPALAATLADWRRQVADTDDPTDTTMQLRLERYAELREALAPRAANDLEVAGLLARVEQRAERYDDSSRWYRAALDQLAADDAWPPDQRRELRRRWVGAVAFNARELGRPAEAEAAYRAELERPDADDHAFFQLQLARHYELGGRPWQALALYEQAAAAPELAAEANQAAARLRVGTPGCLLWRTP